ncbi:MULTISPECIES: hypothetical protein [unclassified Nonomuraea]|uniref:hypothetical protein n=1 Tax=unclassified Nonomuraea TaxID=2593643 RepID=UPI0033EDA4E9
MHDQPWTAAELVAFDLEGTGAQDRQDEPILEIAAVPLAGGAPGMAAAWDSCSSPNGQARQRGPSARPATCAGSPATVAVEVVGHGRTRGDRPAGRRVRRCRRPGGLGRG